MTQQEQETCGICFSQIDEDHTPRGILGDAKPTILCPHVFCEDCILEWSRGTNICPHCRRRFTSITILKKQEDRTLLLSNKTTSNKTSKAKPTPCRGNNNNSNNAANQQQRISLQPGTKISAQDIQKLHKVKRKNLRLDSDEDDELEEGWEQALMPEQGMVCAVCLEKATDMTNVVLCDRRACEYRAHIKCVGLKSVPSFSSGEQWFCPDHRPKAVAAAPQHHQQSQQQQQQQQQFLLPDNSNNNNNMTKNNSSNKPQAARSPSRVSSSNENQELSLEDFIMDEELGATNIAASSSRAASRVPNTNNNNNNMMMMMTSNGNEDIDDKDENVPFLQRFAAEQKGKSPSLAHLSQTSQLMMGGSESFYMMNNNNSQQQLSQDSSIYIPPGRNTTSSNTNNNIGVSPSPRAPHQVRLDNIISMNNNNNNNNNTIINPNRPQDYTIMNSVFTRSQMGQQQQNQNQNQNQQQQPDFHQQQQRQLHQNYLISQGAENLNKLQQIQLEKFQQEEERRKLQEQQQQQLGRGGRGGRGRGGRGSNNAANNNNDDDDDAQQDESDDEEYQLNANNGDDDNNNGMMMMGNNKQNRQIQQNPQQINRYGSGQGGGRGGEADQAWRRADFFQHPLEHAAHLPSAATYGAQPNLIQQQKQNAIEELKRRKEGTDRLNLYRRVQVDNAVAENANARILQQQQELAARRIKQQEQQQARNRLIGTASRNPSKNQGVRSSNNNNTSSAGSSEYGSGQVYAKYGSPTSTSTASNRNNNNNNNLMLAAGNPASRAIMNAVASNRLSVSEALQQVGGPMSLNAQTQIINNINNNRNINPGGLQQQQQAVSGRVVYQNNTNNNNNNNNTSQPGDRIRQRDDNANSNNNQLDFAQHLRQKYFKTYYRHHMNLLNTSNEARSMTEQEDAVAHRQAKQKAEQDLSNLISRFEKERNIEQEKARLRKAAKAEASLRELMAFVQDRRLKLSFGDNNNGSPSGSKSKSPSANKADDVPRPKPVLKLAAKGLMKREDDVSSVKKEM